MDLAFLSLDLLGRPAWMWLGFLALVLGLLALDLGVLSRRRGEIGVRGSLALSAFYVGLGLAFGAWVWTGLGREAGLAWLTGFAVEKALALDNVFVIALIFAHFAVPRALQHRVLFWGILGVIVLRAVMIGFGAAIVSEFAWVLPLFAVFLIATGLKMIFTQEKPHDLADSRLLGWLKRRLRVTDRLEGERFFVRRAHPTTGAPVVWATPLFLALVMVETADVVFAVDSIPAIFAITTDPFLVYTSNIFAILGLRALYFALAAMIERFRLMKYALAGVLVFIGGKVLAAEALGIDEIPAALSLAVTVALLAGGVVASLVADRREARATAGE
ncbi:MAG: TerC family protein [Siculibacillus sp.]